MTQDLKTPSFPLDQPQLLTSPGSGSWQLWSHRTAPKATWSWDTEIPKLKWQITLSECLLISPCLGPFPLDLLFPFSQAAGALRYKNSSNVCFSNSVILHLLSKKLEKEISWVYWSSHPPPSRGNGKKGIILWQDWWLKKQKSPNGPSSSFW